MILVVLAVVWVVALTPMVLRKLSERKFTAGIRTYHRRRLRLGSSDEFSVSAPRSAGSVPEAMSGFSAASQHVQVDRYDAPTPSRQADEPHPGHLSPPTSSTTSPATTARRRQVLATLAGATLLFFLVGIIPAARVMWDLALFGLGCTAIYIALLVHFHRLAVERAHKIIALETRRHATAVLQSRRHILALDRARAIAASRATGTYAAAASGYAGTTQPLLGGSGWSVMGTLPRRATRP